MWTKLENETIYPQDLTLLKYFKIRKFIKVFSILYSPTYFFSDRVLTLVAAGNSWVRLGHGVTIMRALSDVHQLWHHIRISQHWGIDIRGYVWYRGSRLYSIYFECWEKSLKGHSVFLLTVISLELYNIAIADKLSSQLRLKQWPLVAVSAGV